MATDLQQLMRQIEALTPAERAEIRRAIEGAMQSPEGAFEQKLREMGLVSQFGRKRQPRQRPIPVPVRVEGKPLSESLIEERR
ncbi:MAG TPA: hypothetical protein VK797_03200 [Tepidisphaeraceae bacterium]|jgi:hypothetical protein|nr:hypothetical protein [Tepidisphaeraceae bacterium]